MNWIMCDIVCPNGGEQSELGRFLGISRVRQALTSLFDFQTLVITFFVPMISKDCRQNIRLHTGTCVTVMLLIYSLFQIINFF